MIHLTDKLIAIIVPEDAENIRCHTNFNIVSFLIKEKDFEIKIPYKCIKIGTIAKSGEFNFDCEKYVERLDNENSYKDYELEITKDCEYILRTKEESFISLLQSKGIFLEELNNQKILILEKI